MKTLATVLLLTLASLPMCAQTEDAEGCTWLTGHGVAGNSLTAKGLGDAQPVAPNATEDGRSKNRGVDLRKL